MNLQKSTRAGQVSVIPIAIQVAAICYRQGRSGPEFLLVRTSSRRWIFPKGKMDASLSRSEAASREAYEEAGAIGEIEPRSFHLFKYWKESEEDLLLIEAYLMEVFHTTIPQEEHREPTWFTPEAAQRVIADGREPKCAAELAAVIHAAVRKIRSTSSRRRPVVRRRSGNQNWSV